ncbi:MAG: cbb3-type cytochrome oxidase subunit 3 [Hyphomicrobiaceae bacterium]
MEALNDTATALWLVGGIVVFAGIVLWIFRRGAKKRYEEKGKIPLRRD